jgi:hypothetical protein
MTREELKGGRGIKITFIMIHMGSGSIMIR